MRRRVGCRILVGATALLLASPVAAQTIHYRSIGASGSVASGDGATLAAGSTQITFSAPLPESVGLGDQIALGNESFFVSQRIDDTTLAVETAATATHTEDGWSVNRAFTRVNEWESSREGNLVNEDRVEVGVVRGALEATRDPMLDIEGFTIDASHYVALIGWPEHGGSAGGGARLVGTGTETGILIRQPYTVIEGLELTGFATALDVRDSSVLLNRLLVHDNATGIDDSGQFVVRNSIVYDGGVGMRLNGGGAAETPSRVDNCTVWGLATAGIDVNASTVEIRNTISVGSAVDFSGAAEQSNNISTDDSAVGPDCQTKVDPATLFVSADLATVDLHLLDSAPARNAGLDLSASFNEDVERQQREAGAWDVGADEYGALPTATPTPGPGETPTPPPGSGSDPQVEGGGISCSVQHASRSSGVFSIALAGLLGGLLALARRRWS